MHTLDGPSKPLVTAGDQPWWRLLNRYHWFVFIVCTLGWLFDTMDQQLFNIARNPAMRALVPEAETDPKSWVAKAGGDVTSIFLIGWGAGGLIFGVLGDVIGRARSMILTILLYSVF